MLSIHRRAQRSAAALSALAFISTIAMSTPTQAAAPLSPAERAFVGEYVQSGNEAMAQMAVLDDRTFCFAFMGGSVDLLLAGHWKIAADDKSFQLTEVKLPRPPFPAMASPAQSPTHTVFELHGYSLSEAVQPVFATSATDAEPSEFRPLFSDSHGSWAERYTLPPVPADQARYFYIGSSENDPNAPFGSAARNAPKRFKVVQYELRSAAKLLLGYNGEQSLVDLSQPVRLVGEMLHLGAQPFAKRRPISAERAEEAREGCIRPTFAQAAEKPTNRGELVPLKTFHVEPTRVKGTPWVPGQGR